MESWKKRAADKANSYIPEPMRLLQQGTVSRRGFLRAMAVLGVSAVVAACTPAKSAPEQPTTASAATVVPAATQVPTAGSTATSAPTAQQSRVLRIANTGMESSGFDIASTGSGQVPVASLMYEGLVRYKGGTADVEPWLAKSWETSPDNTTTTFHLQQGVQWQKGYGEFTADDVKFAIDRIVNDKLPEAANWANLDHVEVVDKYTVKIVMKSPSPTLFTLSLPFQAGMILCQKAVQDLGAKAFNETPVGTGPYELESYDVGQSIKFKKFNNYWGTRVLDADEVVIVFPSDSITSLQAGDIDVAPEDMHGLANAKALGDTVGLASRLTRYWWISLPCTDPILKDINARKAIRAAIDVNAIIEAAGYGMAIRGYAMVPPGIVGYWADAPHYERDVNQAKQFLKDAGYPDGFHIPFLAVSNPPDPAVEVVRQQLAEVGIILDVDAVDDSTYWSLVCNGKHATVISYQTLPDGDYTLEYFVTNQQWNTMKWSNKQFDDLLKQEEGTIDANARAQMLIQMQKLMDDDCAMVFIGYQPQGVAYRKAAVNLGPNDEALLINGVLDTSRLRMV